MQPHRSASTMSLHLDARDAVYKLTTTLQERLVTQPQRSSVCVRRLRGFCSLHPRMCVRVLPPQHGNALERRSAGSTHLMRLNATRTWLTTTALKVSAQLLESMTFRSNLMHCAGQRRRIASPVLETHHQRRVRDSEALFEKGEQKSPANGLK